MPFERPPAEAVTVSFAAPIPERGATFSHVEVRLAGKTVTVHAGAAPTKFNSTAAVPVGDASPASISSAGGETDRTAGCDAAETSVDVAVPATVVPSSLDPVI